MQLNNHLSTKAYHNNRVQLGSEPKIKRVGRAIVRVQNIISNAEHLKQLAGSTATFVLTQDINATKDTGNIQNFAGVLNGKNHTITGLQHCLFNNLKGNLSNVNLAKAHILQQSSSPQAIVAAGVVADILEGGTISNVHVTDSYVFASATGVDGAASNETGGEAYAGSVVGRTLHNTSLENVTAKNNVVAAQASFTANTGGILGAHKNSIENRSDTLTAKGLEVYNCTLRASSQSTAIASGAIGDATNGCNRPQTCDNISVSKTRIAAVNPPSLSKSGIPSVAAGILSGNQNIKAGSQLNVTGNTLSATCKYDTVGSLDNCPLWTTPTTPDTHWTSVSTKAVTIAVSTKATFFYSLMGGLAVAALGFVAGSYIKAYREGKTGWDLVKAPYQNINQLVIPSGSEYPLYRRRLQQPTEVIETDSEEEEEILALNQTPDEVLSLDNDAPQAQSNQSLTPLSFGTPTLDSRRVMVQIHRHNSNLDLAIDINLDLPIDIDDDAMLELV